MDIKIPRGEAPWFTPHITSHLELALARDHFENGGTRTPPITTVIPRETWVNGPGPAVCEIGHPRRV